MCPSRFVFLQIASKGFAGVFASLHSHASALRCRLLWKTHPHDDTRRRFGKTTPSRTPTSSSSIILIRRFGFSFFAEIPFEGLRETSSMHRFYLNVEFLSKLKNIQSPCSKSHQLSHNRKNELKRQITTFHQFVRICIQVTRSLYKNLSLCFVVRRNYRAISSRRVKNVNNLISLHKVCSTIKITTLRYALRLKKVRGNSVAINPSPLSMSNR